ncbi:MAG: AAA family ATPase [bacterium]
MKLDALHLTAFGPFTGVTLDFSRGDPGFHLVYGPNEAGKSSALRALRSLLYGIDERTPDSFIHPYPRLRVGGKLSAENGKSLEIVRRKGRTNTLRAADDLTLVDETVLEKFLNFVDADLFATMFGIGYDDLVRGGKEIVSGGGDLGQLVFSAGSGIVRLKEIREALCTEAESLFKPSGKVPSINAALLRFKEIENRLKGAMLPGSRWSGLNKELDAALKERDSVEEQLRENQKARNQLARIKEALPLIARRREVTESLGQYENAVLLPDDFPETRRDLVAKLDMAAQEEDRAQKAINAIESQMADLWPNDALIENSGLIEEYHRELGSRQKAASERIKLETNRAALLDECREILRGLSEGLSLEDAERLRIKKDRAEAIRRLSSEYEQIIARIEDARDLLPGLEHEIGSLEGKKRKMTPPVDRESMDALQTALAEASEYGPLEKQNQQDIKNLGARKSSLENRLKKMGLAGKNSRELEKLPVPDTETIRMFENSLDQAADYIREITREQKEIKDRIRESEAKIKAGQMAHAVPSEDDLNRARDKRDRGWSLIRRKIEGGSLEHKETDSYLFGLKNEQDTEAESLEDAFEHCLKTSDELADRLRREADRVAEHARLSTDLEAAMQRKQELDVDYEKAKKDREKLNARWSELWEKAGINAGTPREMENWRRDFAGIKQDLSELENSMEKAQELNRQISARRKALTEVLKPLDTKTDPDNDPLSKLIFRAQKIIEDENRLASQYKETDSEIASRRKELASAKNRLEAGERALERWRSQWQEAVSFLGLSSEAKPDEANAVMEEIRILFEKLREAENLYKRIQGIDRDAQGFKENVNGLAETVAPDLLGKPAEDIALKLHTRLTASREARTRHDALEKQLASEKENLEKARKTASQIRTRLARMCEETGCKDYHELPEAEKRSRRRRELEEELKSLEDRILALSAGSTVEEFTQAAAAVDPDTIDPEIQKHDEAIEHLSGRKDSLAEKIGSLKNEMSKMDGSPEAAELAQERQEILGRMDPQVRRYARAKIAARILDTAIERFREKNQGPMLRRASGLFSEITCGAFKGLRADIDEAGKPVITGVRGNDEEPVDVSGMSDGTADQLYLALRLAGLEMSIEKTNPMPFIVDDILIKFDNDRASAALKVLADLSASTQVIFFTHHYHLVELAKQSLPQNSIICHKL